MDYTNYNSLSTQEKAQLILELLKEDYPDVSTPLLHRNEFELLVAVMFSAQSTDDVTNRVTPILFERYPDAKSLSESEFEDVLDIIRYINYNKTKAKRAIDLAQMLLDEFEGEVPQTIAELTKLPGVGRKTANVIINEWFVKRGLAQPEGFVVDTHVLRVGKRLGLTKNEKPELVEQDLMKLYEPKDWDEASLRFIFHGREWSQAKKPQYHENRIWSPIYKSMGY